MRVSKNNGNVFEKYEKILKKYIFDRSWFCRFSFASFQDVNTLFRRIFSISDTTYDVFRIEIYSSFVQIQWYCTSILEKLIGFQNSRSFIGCRFFLKMQSYILICILQQTQHTSGRPFLAFYRFLCMVAYDIYFFCGVKSYAFKIYFVLHTRYENDKCNANIQSKYR